jgi:hypothetical protein
MTRARMPLIAAVALLTPVLLSAQHPAKEKATANKMSDSQKITNAMSAAPEGIAKDATIMDWADTPKGQPRQLRAGSNGWVCYPSTPSALEGTSGEDPMCLDKEWQKWAEAWMSKTEPKLSATGIAYMLHGDRGASNTDPFAMSASASNHWVVSPPHIMVLYQDPKQLDSYPDDPKTGGPWVMWKGSPYAHLMVPVSEKKMAMMPSK